MRSVVVRCECKGLRAGWTPLFDKCIREGIEQHVEHVANKGIPVELLHHVAPHLKDELQVLWSEELRWTLAAYHVWVGQ
jgi:hypothetical protein